MLNGEIGGGGDKREKGGRKGNGRGRGERGKAGSR